MRSRVMPGLAVGICLTLAVGVVLAQTSKPLAGIKIVQVDPTVVLNPDKVKEEHAANQVADSLRNALKDANFEIGDAPIRAHIVLDEFTSGSTAKRFMVGFGAGRSTVDCRLVILDADGKELANAKIRVRGNLIFSPYQGNNTQRRQAVSSFEQRLLEEIEKLK
jgi:hypothetical protein